MRFKNFERKPKRKSQKRTIFAKCGLGLLQIVSEPKTGSCASKEAEPQREWTRGSVPARTLGGGGMGGPTSIVERERVPTRTLGLEGGWIVRSQIGWGGERNILYKDVKTSP